MRIEISRDQTDFYLLLEYWTDSDGKLDVVDAYPDRGGAVQHRDKLMAEDKRLDLKTIGYAIRHYRQVKPDKNPDSPNP